MKRNGYNRFGLSRSIPASIKRDVRQKCGFGCVVCGIGIIQYEHVDPEFYNATEHDAECITLLCPTCHARVTTGSHSKQSVKRAMKNPAALRLGYARDFFDLCGNNPKIKMGGIEFSRCRVPIRIFDKDILRIDPPTIGGDGFLLSGLFCDGDGRPTLKVDKNEWIAYTDSWDVTVKGGVIEIRSGPGDIVLRLAASPPDGIVVDKLRMKFGFVEFYADPNRMLLITPFGIQEFSNIGLDYGTVGLSLFSLNEPWVDPRLNSYAKLVRHHAIYGKDFLHEYLSYLRQTG